uniref:Uncharacterized protein n=1 Tax=Caenorhabditis japonica TaxID=281687 RepID=A0A8R1HXT9_CAEJA
MCKTRERKKSQKQIKSNFLSVRSLARSFARPLVATTTNNNNIQEMSYVQSSYADQKPKQENLSSSSAAVAAAAIPASTPIAEDPLSPAQIQEAIRIYRSVLSTSTPSSPVQHAPVAVAAPERPEVHSNYYGGGPTDIPQSYLLNYSPSRAAQAPAPVVPVAYVAPPPPPPPAQAELTEQELLARLQALQLEQQAQAPSPVQTRATPRKAPLAQRIYDDEESGYCFNRKKNGANGQDDEQAPEPQIHTPIAEPVQQQAYTQPSPAPTHNYSKPMMTGPSEYIGMSNDNRFIYDAQKALPAYSHQNSYTLVSATPQAPILRQEEPEEYGTSTTEDVTQVPASPAVTSRFRGIIQNVQTPVQATAPIVVERVGATENSYHQAPINNNHNYGAFMPVNQLSMESEYQLPVLNDLASCIEHY